MLDADSISKPMFKELRKKFGFEPDQVVAAAKSQLALTGRAIKDSA